MGDTKKVPAKEKENTKTAENVKEKKAPAKKAAPDAPKSAQPKKEAAVKTAQPAATVKPEAKTAKQESVTAAKPAAKPAAQPKQETVKQAAPKAEQTKKEAAPAETVKKAELPAKTLSGTSVKAVMEQSREIKKSDIKPAAGADKKTGADKKKILFVASEVQPFAGTGGLGEVIGSLGKSIVKIRSDYDIRVVLPLYESVTKEIRDKLRYLKHINVQLSWRSQYCGIFEYKESGVTYYFIDNEYYYKRPNLYGYYDDGERFAFFSKAALDILPEVDFCPDVINANDWQTALVPVYYKLYYLHRDWYSRIKTVFTIHNIEYQGKYGRSIIEDVFGIAYKEYPSIEHGGCINLMKSAIDYADCVTTVSPSYAQEILTEYYAHGLHGVLQKNSHKLRGILNGIDVDVYNSETDASLFARFSAGNVDIEKIKNKTELQAMVNLPIDAKVPVIAVISRLVGHKGLDLIKHVMNELITEDVQLIILGKGDADYENYFSYMQGQYPNKICSIIAYNKDLSHKIYGSTDFFLMPSKSEPCGLSQMIACRYGTVPIVRETGGLKDSIIDAGDGTTGNGYKFVNYNAHDMLGAVKRAIGLYKSYPDIYKGLRKRAMQTDFSWSKSALEYIKMYDWIIG